jgi:hypothetical protein
MSTTLSNGVTTITPTLVTGWASTQQSNTQLHAIIGNASPDVTVRPANLRAGTLGLVFSTEADAETCRTMHSAANIFTLTSTDLDQIDMSYVVAGTIAVTLDDTTLNTWIVDIDYQEVTT